MSVVKALKSGEDEPVSRDEIVSVLADIVLAHNEGAQARYRGQRAGRLKGAFTHIGAIGSLGRESDSKFSAVFGTWRYPGSNCGISILGG